MALPRVVTMEWWGEDLSSVGQRKASVGRKWDTESYKSFSLA